MAAYRETPDDQDGRIHGAGAAAGSPAPDLRGTSLTPTNLSTRQFRVITANVQSIPEGALTMDEALEDLRRNAADGDLVLLQEIAERYQPLVKQAFPASDWGVYYGEDDNKAPIAFRKSVFAQEMGRVMVLHDPRPGIVGRRYLTYVRLNCRSLGVDVHATNLHMVPGAFSHHPTPDRDERIDMWNAGIAKHLAFVERLVKTGQPVVGGGDYNRVLKQHKSVGARIGGKPVRYAVDSGSIDLLWLVDGDDATWNLKSKAVFRGRKAHEDAERNSDHGARQATLVLRAGKQDAPQAPPVKHHPPFEKTLYGDTTLKTIDWKTRAALEEAERRLGYTLTIVQGSYNTGVSQSAGTHDGGGVVDLKPYDWQRKVRVLRSIGFAAWHRPAITGLWGEHIHAVLIDHGKLSPSAKRQVIAYLDGKNGLKSNLPDSFWRPSPIPRFQYPPKEAAPGAGQPHPEPAPPMGSPFPPRRTLDGIDTSHHQGGRIDVPRAQAHGLRFWYLKTTEGDSWTDPTYQRRMKEARKAGIPVGSYHFARPDLGDAAKEARHFLTHAQIRAGDMIPMLDLESLEGLSLPQVTNWTGLWVATVEKELRKKGLVGKPIIYTRFDLGSAFGCMLWVARYSNPMLPPRIPKPWRRAALWQHSNGVFGAVKDVPGFGHVDVSALHPDVPLSALRVKKIKPATPVPAPGSDPALRTVSTELRAAAQSIQTAYDALPER